jgi:hypothetical protein
MELLASPKDLDGVLKEKKFPFHPVQMVVANMAHQMAVANMAPKPCPL